jgi:hypothetical protein
LTANTQSPTLDYVTAYEIRANVFSKLFEKYKTCIYNGMDYNIYGELSFLVGFCQNNYDAMQLKEKDPKTYNFYKDSNISEVLQCVELLQKVKQRVLIELQEWPEHAILNDVRNGEEMIVNYYFHFYSFFPHRFCWLLIASTIYSRQLRLFVSIRAFRFYGKKLTSGTVWHIA